MNRIKELRSSYGWRQQDLADKMSTDKSVISRYEREELGLDPALIHTLCDLFGCTADYLLGRSDIRTPAVSGEDAAVLEAYHALPPELRRAVDGILEPYRAGVQEKMAAS